MWMNVLSQQRPRKKKAKKGISAAQLWPSNEITMWSSLLLIKASRRRSSQFPFALLKVPWNWPCSEGLLCGLAKTSGLLIVAWYEEKKQLLLKTDSSSSNFAIILIETQPAAEATIESWLKRKKKDFFSSKIGATKMLQSTFASVCKSNFTWVKTATNLQRFPPPQHHHQLFLAIRTTGCLSCTFKGKVKIQNDDRLQYHHPYPPITINPTIFSHWQSSRKIEQTPPPLTLFLFPLTLTIICFFHLDQHWWSTL